jgi:glycosyltransferase involved in cell wall biosynthesis
MKPEPSSAERMRIAYVIIDANRSDGTSRAMVEVAERCARQHEVHLFSHSMEDVDTSRILWHRVAAWPWPELPKFASFVVNCSAALSAEKFDIVHSAGCNTAFADVYTVQNVQPAKERALRAEGAFSAGGALRTLHRLLYFRVTSAAERLIYRAGSRRTPFFLPVSRGVARELAEFHRVPEDRMSVIPNGADLERFNPSHRDAMLAACRSRYGLAPEDFVLLFVGGEWKRKGLDHAIDAMARIPDPKVKLLVIGWDADIDRYRAQARSLGVGARIVFGGFTADVHQCCAAADLFVFPSCYEAFSLATIEAAASGLPVLAAKVNGTEELIRPGENGEFIPRDGRSIAEAVMRLAADTGLRARMGRRAREIAEREYSWDSIAERTIEVYRRVTDERRQRSGSLRLVL